MNSEKAQRGYKQYRTKPQLIPIRASAEALFVCGGAGESQKPPGEIIFVLFDLLRCADGDDAAALSQKLASAAGPPCGEADRLAAPVGHPYP